MADRVLLFTWGQVVRGREQRALEVFNETLAFYAGLQQDGRIERFDVALLNPNGFLNGFIAIHGSVAQLAALREDDQFRRLIAEAALIIDDQRLLDGYIGEGVQEALTPFQQAIEQVPQHA
jgi:hypothetical protein